jgi:alpha-pyrone synthase
MTPAYLNKIATAVPAHDVHDAFVHFARTLLETPQAQKVFDRLAQRSQIAHRYSIFPAAADPAGESIDATGVYRRGQFPSTGERMRLYEQHALPLAIATVAKLAVGDALAKITHVIVTSCTGMYAPGLDLDLVAHFGLNPAVERTMIGFMGCYAAINALKSARHIVRSEPAAHVLVVNLELCSLHFQQVSAVEPMLSFLVFGDGCAASIVSAEPVGFALDSFRAVVVPNSADLITWNIRDHGFEMFLSGQVPAAITRGLGSRTAAIFGDVPAASIDLWAVHPGGRSVLDAVETALELRSDALAASRKVLLDYGNMSSATVMFVLHALLASAEAGKRGCAMSFGPGLTAETMQFRKV